MRKRATGGVRAKSGPAFDPDVPVVGHFRIKLVRDGPPAALKIWFGPPVEPWTGELMDRAPRWLASVNGGEPVDALRYWPGCARDPISEAEFERLVERSRTLDDRDGFFDPLRPVDRLKIPPPF